MAPIVNTPPVVEAPVEQSTSPSIATRVRPELPGIVLGCLCLAATNSLALAIPWLIKSAIDALRTLPPAVAHGRVVRDAVAIIACAVFQALIRTWSRILIFNVGRNIEYGLRRDVFEHLCRMDAGFFRRHPTGDVMSRLTNDLGSVRMLFGPGLLNVFNTAFVYATTLVLLVRLSPQLTLWALLPYPALLAGARVFTRRMYRASRAIAEQLGTLSAAIQEDLAGIAVIKSYTLEESREASFRTLNDEYLRRSLAMVRARGALMPLFAGLGGLGTLVVLWAGGREVIGGRLSIGGLVAFNAYLVLLSWPTVALGWIIGIWQRGLASWVRVKELLASRPSIGDPETAPGKAAPATPAAPSIEARDLGITIEGRRLLDGVSFSLPAGGTLAIVGPTGSGKTTLVDALLRMQDVAPGALLHRRRRRHGHAAPATADPDRLRAAGRVSVLRHAWPRTSASGARGPRTPTRFGRRRKRRGSVPTSQRFPRDTTRWWASGASRFPVVSGSGWPWPAHWPPTRGCSSSTIRSRR